MAAADLAQQGAARQQGVDHTRVLSAPVIDDGFAERRADLAHDPGLRAGIGCELLRRGDKAVGVPGVHRRQGQREMRVGEDQRMIADADSTLPGQLGPAGADIDTGGL